MKLNSIKLAVVASLLFLGACTGDFENKNTNPDEVTDEMLTWDNLNVGSAFSQLTQNIVPIAKQLTGNDEYGSANYQVACDLEGNIFSGYTAATNSGFDGNNVYNLEGKGWRDALHDDAFKRAMGPWAQINEFREEAPQAAAMADICKVIVMQRVTDAYGPIAYTSVGKGGIQQGYDSQETIYHAFFTELDNAIDILTTFATLNSSATVLAKYDPIYHGDVKAWVKLANTIRLRAAMRVVYVDQNLAKTEGAAALANPIGLMTTAGDIAQYEKPALMSTWENPLYVIQYEFNGGDGRIGATIESYMNGYKDPRRAKYFTATADGSYHGVRNGINPSNLNSYRDMSKISAVTLGKNDPMVWVKPAEAWFLRAEYEARFGTIANARQYYEEGIKVSFATEGVTGADAYIADAESVPANYDDPIVSSNSAAALSTITIAWDDNATLETALEKIITQKYIAMFPEGQEAWAEFRRTGYPKVFPNKVNNSQGKIDTNKQIRRLIYPSSERTSNAEALEAGIALLNGESNNAKGDVGGTNLWWDKK